MKKINIAYWVLTVLLAALMGSSAIPNIISSADSVAFFKLIDMPAYLLPFLGVAKLLGAIVVLLPGFNRLKEWVYAGFFFDLTGAAYACLASGFPVTDVLMFLLFYALLFGSYFLHHARLKSVKG